MGLFRPKLPCAHCGKPVRRARDPADFSCPHCHQPGPWASREQANAWEQAQAERQRAEQARGTARKQYGDALELLVVGGDAQAESLAALANAAGYSRAEVEEFGVQTFQRYATLVLADDVI